MGLVLSLHRVAIRFWWFTFAVLPGALLMRIHANMQVQRGDASVRLMPKIAYRLMGLILASTLFVIVLATSSAG